MSKKEINNQPETGKYVSNYERKKLQREQALAKEQQEKKKSLIISILIAAALVALVASFPIRTYMSLKKTICTVGNEAISQVEFDYAYNTVIHNYVSQYGDYISYFGLDLSKDLGEQSYSDTMTWEDFFQETTVDNLKRSKSLKADAQKNGFTYDTTEDYKQFVEAEKDSAKQEGVSVKDYLKEAYGSLATFGRIEPYVKEALFLSAYLDQITENTMPTEEQVRAAYEEHKDNYDSVDYRITTIDADLSDIQGEEPTEEEITKAMEAAREEAEKAFDVIDTEGTLTENGKLANTVTVVANWLYEEGRAAKEATILEDTTAHKYYVVQFEKRYLEETPTVDVRVLMTADGNGQEILDAWNNTAKTEESFAELCDGQYSQYALGEGGLNEGVLKAGLYQELSDWLYDPARKAGDTEVIAVAEGAEYVMYYIGQNQPEWYMTILGNLSAQAVEAYIDQVSADCQVLDPDNHLKFIQIREAEAAQEAQE